MAEDPKWTIELTGDGAETAPWATYVTRSATLVTDGTDITVPKGTTRTSSAHEALQKAVAAVLNDMAAGN